MSDNQANRAKRTVRNTLIEPFKQVKLGVYVMGITMLFLAAFSFLFVSAFYQQYQHVMEIFNVVDPNTKWDLVVNPVFRDNALKLLVAFVAFIVILFAVIFRTTHRYYGPLVSIERFVSEISAGNYRQRVSIRRGDELGRLVEALNNMADQLDKRHGSKPRVISDEAQKAAKN